MNCGSPDDASGESRDGVPPVFGVPSVVPALGPGVQDTSATAPFSVRMPPNDAGPEWLCATRMSDERGRSDAVNRLQDFPIFAVADIQSKHAVGNQTDSTHNAVRT